MNATHAPSDRRLLVTCLLLALPSLAIDLVWLLDELKVPAASAFNQTLVNAMDVALLGGGALCVLTVPSFLVVFFRRVWGRPAGVSVALMALTALTVWPVLLLALLAIGLQDLS